MTKKVRQPQAPKQRNFVAKAMLDRDGPYTPKAVPYKKKIKHKKGQLNDDFDE